MTRADMEIRNDFILDDFIFFNFIPVLLLVKIFTINMFVLGFCKFFSLLSVASSEHIISYC